MVDVLNNDVLLEIFSYLNKIQRKQMIIVCRRWHEVLTQSPKFLMESPLNLQSCFISKNYSPMSLLQHPSRKFPHIILGLKPFYGNNIEIKEFCNLISNDTTVITLCASVNEKPIERDLFLHFPNLQRINFSHCCKILDFEIPKSVKHLHFKSVANLKSSYPIKLQNCMQDVLSKIQEMVHLEKITSDSIWIPYDTHGAKTFINVGHIKILVVLRKLIFRYGNFFSGTGNEIGIKSKINLLKENVINFDDVLHIKNFSNINMFKIQCNYDLDSLFVDGDMKFGFPFCNLKYLVLRLSWACFFVHQVLHLRNVCKLKIDNLFPSNPCTECCANLIPSLPNLTELDIGISQLCLIGIEEFFTN